MVVKNFSPDLNSYLNAEPEELGGGISLGHPIYKQRPTKFIKAKQRPGSKISKSLYFFISIASDASFIPILTNISVSRLKRSKRPLLS